MYISIIFYYLTYFQDCCAICCGRIQTRTWPGGEKTTVGFRSLSDQMLLLNFWIDTIWTWYVVLIRYTIVLFFHFTLLFNNCLLTFKVDNFAGFFLSKMLLTLNFYMLKKKKSYKIKIYAFSQCDIRLITRDTRLTMTSTEMWCLHYNLQLIVLLAGGRRRIRILCQTTVSHVVLGSKLLWRVR